LFAVGRPVPMSRNCVIPGFGGQVADRAGEEPALHPGDVRDAGERLHDQVTGRAVGREVVLAAEQVVPDPGRMRLAGVELGRHPRPAW
jgi:hypothetical protein